MTEKTIEQYLRDEVKKIGGKAYKFVSPGNNGVPDRLICLPGGSVVFAETKAPSKKPTPQQLAKQRELIKLGFNVFGCVDSTGAVDLLIRFCLGMMK